jgi:hypothetical protein
MDDVRTAAPTRRSARQAERGRRTPGRAPGPWRLVAIVASVAVLAVLALAGGGWAWRTVAAGNQREAYAEGHRAYLAGDCPAAVTAFDDADRRYLDDTLAATARGERAECRELLDAAPAGAPAADRVDGLLGYVRGKPPAPLRAAAVRQARALFIATPAVPADDELCRKHGLVVPAGLLPPTGDAGPSWLVRCAVAAERAKNLWLAKTLSEAVVATYPKSPRAKTSRTAAIRLDVLHTFSLGARRLETWLPTGTTSAPTALIGMSNGSSQQLTIRFTGPVTTQLVVPPCKDCDPGRRVDNGCGFEGIERTISLPPGRYRMTYSPGLDPVWMGTMTFEASTKYGRCQPGRRATR